MSYCRFSCDNGLSDVYCYESTEGGFDVWHREGDINLDTREKCLNFLVLLRKKGQRVPQHAIDRLGEEINSGCGHYE